MRGWLFLGLLLAAIVACGPSGSAPDAARVALNVSIPAPVWRGYAYDPTAELQKITPTTLVVLVCDDITKKGFDIPCNRDNADTYNARQEFRLDPPNPGRGSMHVPPGVEQVVFAQGIAQIGVTYQGYVTLPVIQPRQSYSVELKLVQVRFADLPPPEPPNVIVPPSTTKVDVPFGTNTFTFEGTREAGTRLRVQQSVLLGGVKEFMGSEPGLYEEAESGGVTAWTLHLPLSSGQRPQKYIVTFEVAREGENRYSTPIVQRTLSLCSSSNVCP